MDKQYESGTIQVIQRSGRVEFRTIILEKFESRKDLKRLLFQFKGTPVEVVLVFDEPTEGFTLEASLDTPI